MNFTVNPLGPAAAEIIGLDCARSFDNDLLNVVKRTYTEYPILVFRDQTLTAPQLAAFCRQFGQPEGYGNPPGAANKGKSQTAALRQTDARETPDQMLYQSPDDPDVLIMTNEKREGLPVIGIVDNAETWHSDASHKTKPCQAVIVYVLRNPTAGGDTEFCDLCALYDTLPPDVKSTLNGLVAAHHWSKAINPRFANTLDPAARAEGERIARLVPEMLHPLVRTHPESGRYSLYLSPRFTLRIEGVDKNVSDTILNEIFNLAEDPIFHYRHQWREKDLMIWDNRCLNHRVRSYDIFDIRTRYRVSIAGFQPYFRPAIS